MLKFYFVKHYFSPINKFMGKGKVPETDSALEPDLDPELDPDPYL